MWLLYIILLVDGHSIVKAQAFETKAQCVSTKQAVFDGVTQYPNIQASLTCVKINKIGKIS